MVIFPFPQYKYVVKSLKLLPEIKIGKFSVGRFPNQEIFIELQKDVKNKDCLIICSITPPDENLISFLLLSHTLKKEGASRTAALLPYLAYARQDKEKKGESLATASVGELLSAAHVSEVITVDTHSHKVEDLFPIPIYNLSPSKLFAQEIKKLNLKNPTIVAPDEGAMERVQKTVEEYGSGVEIAFMKKKRTPSGVSSVLYGHVSKNVVIIDDILDTGGTLLACCKILKSKGAQNIYVFVTHGLFTGSDWLYLFDVNVKKIYCTDSIPKVYTMKQKGLNILPIAPLIEEYSHHLRKIQQDLKRIYHEIEEVKIIEPEEPPLLEE